MTTDFRAKFCQILASFDPGHEGQTRLSRQSTLLCENRTSGRESDEVKLLSRNAKVVFHGYIVTTFAEII